MKKYIAFSLSLVMLLLCVVTVSASSSTMLVVGDAEGGIGDEVIVPISLDNNPGFVSMSLSVSYDTSALTLISCEYTDVISGSMHSANYTSPYKLTWDNDTFLSNIKATGTIAYLTFLVNGDADEGDYSIIVRIPTDGILDANGNTVSASSAMGTITVSAEHKCSFGDWEDYSRTKHVRECAECGEKEYDNHNWNDGEITEQPDHENEGEIKYTCEGCDRTKTTEIDPEGHDWSDWTKLSDTQHKRTCSCGDTETEAHNWDNGVTSASIITYTCEDCEATKTETIAPDTVPVTGITLNASSVTLKIGETDSKLLKATIEPSDANNQAIIWVSSNPSVAKINISVNKMYADIIALAEGTTTITATTEDGSFVAQCVVTVIESEPDNIPVTGIMLNESTVTVKVGDGKFVDATVLPDNATNKLVNWTCSDPTIADIAWSGDNNSRGLIVGRAAGTTVITASTADGSFVAQCTVTVIDDDTPVDPNAPAISIDNVTSSAGKTVEVNIALKNNPGILGASFTLSYSEELTLISAQKGEALSSLTYTAPGELSNPCRFGWDGVDESNANGVILKLTFKVPDNAKQGDSYAINVSYDNGSIFNDSMNAINFSVESGFIIIPEYISGDLNDDGIINMQDVVLLRRYIVGGYNVVINDLAADVNRDGLLNMQDVVLIRRYIVGGYEVELK